MLLGLILLEYISTHISIDSRSLHRLVKLSASALAVALFSGCATQPQLHESTALNNVAYASVTEIAVTPPSQKYSYGEHDSQEVWYYEPAKNTDYQSAVVFIHGGCWLSQFDITHTQALSNALSKHGFAVWNVEYRSTGNGGEWPVALHDIQRAIAKLGDIKGAHLDLSTVNIVGHSAGGHLAMLAAGDVQALSLPKSTTRVKTIGLAPIVDIETYSVGENSCQTATPQFMQGTQQERPNEYAAASVLNVTLNKSLSYALVGGKDTIVPLEYSKHPDAQLLRVEEAGHFDWIHPGTDAFKQLLVILKTD